MPATCNGCGAPIAWRKTPDGKNMPLDPGPHPDGNVVLEVRGGQRVAVVAAAGSHQTMYRPHWATCPKAGQFRRKRPANAPP